MTEPKPFQISVITMVMGNSVGFPRKNGAEGTQEICHNAGAGRQNIHEDTGQNDPGEKTAAPVICLCAAKVPCVTVELQVHRNPSLPPERIM